MRNLIGRLNARSQSDLDRIAAAWHVIVTAPDKPGTVAQIVRILTDIRAVRDAWSALDDDDQRLIAHLAAARESQTLTEIASALSRDEADVRATAIRLYRSGWIAREGDNSELRIDELPRLFVPPELAGAVSRVRAELLAGDRTAVPLTQLLRELDPVELESAAQIWGVPVVAGLRSRDELIALLTTAVSEPGAIDRVVSALDPEALALFQAVRDGPTEGIPLDEALNTRTADPIRPSANSTTWSLLGRLERALLVWNGYDWKGERKLFVPADIRAPRPRIATLPPATIDLADASAAATHHFHLAWDLLTLLRALASPDPPRTRPGDPFPVSFLEWLNRRFWHHGADRPPDGYVPFLTALARAEGLIVAEQGRGPLVLTSDLRAWRDRSFEEQDARLRWRWLTAIEWIEGTEQSETTIWGADWRTMRRSLLEALAELPDDGWRPLDLVISWIIEREPTLLGRAYTIAVGIGVDDEGAGARRIAAASVLSLTLRRALAWLGLVETRRAAAHGHVVRLTQRGRAIATGRALDDATSPAVFAVNDDATIVLTNPSPLHIWSVSAFADQLGLGPPARYRVSPRSVERAIEAGFQSSQVASFLRTQSGRALPESVSGLLDREQRQHPIVQIEAATLVVSVSANGGAEIRQILTSAGITFHEIGNEVLVRASAADLEKLTTMLRSAGMVIRSPGPL